MEVEEYSNLIWKIKKSFPIFNIKEAQKKGSNKILYFKKNEYELRIGWSHKNVDDLIFGVLSDNEKLFIIGEENFNKLEEIFRLVENSIQLIESGEIKALFK